MARQPVWFLSIWTAILNTVFCHVNTALKIKWSDYSWPLFCPNDSKSYPYWSVNQLATAIQFLAVIFSGNQMVLKYVYDRFFTVFAK
jgi:hypothetical protein